MPTLSRRGPSPHLSPAHRAEWGGSPFECRLAHLLAVLSTWLWMTDCIRGLALSAVRRICDKASRAVAVRRPAKRQAFRRNAESVGRICPPYGGLRVAPRAACSPRRPTQRALARHRTVRLASTPAWTREKCGSVLRPEAVSHIISSSSPQESNWPTGRGQRRGQCLRRLPRPSGRACDQGEHSCTVLGLA